MTIPAWNAVGVLPPVHPFVVGSSLERSPYSANLVELIDRFATTPQRMTILNGMVQFRSKLYQAGIVSGFQWFDGSFMEDVETLEHRPPNDMDVVTFFHLPEGYDQELLHMQNQDLFDHKKTKASFLMDAYYVVLGEAMDETIVKRVAYWYSMWSHRRDSLWKGFVQVTLDPTQDTAAERVLSNLQEGNHHE